MFMYTHPISSRYPAPHTSCIWAQENRTIVMRNLWISLASAQQKLGISVITDTMLEEMTKQKGEIDFDVIRSYEKKYGHDIIAHIHAFGDVCPQAKKIIHLGTTSNFINDNTDAVLIRDSMKHIQMLATKLFDVLKELSLKYIRVSTLAYTHLQPAQLITIGKRFTMWNADLFEDVKQLQSQTIPFRGVKGTVGSEDTMLKLFDGDYEKCKLLNQQLAREYGFSEVIPICGQTYSRKYDVGIFHVLSSICQTVYKMANDLRLLASHSLIKENFTEHQVGSSAMPYKQNPIHLEQICSLCRYVIGQESVIANTYINQWLERSLDDSAVKRILYPECFMLVEYILNTCIETLNGLFIDESVCKEQVDTRLKYIVSEEIMICGVKMGYDRQELHERIRKRLIYDDSSTMTLMEIYGQDEILKKIIETAKINCNTGMDYVGCCEEQVRNFYLTSYPLL